MVLLDVLHYLSQHEQQAVLRRARDAMSCNGRILLRVADAGASGRVVLTQWIDRGVARLRGHGGPRAVRPLQDWMAQLRALGLQVQAFPMSEGTPFANVLLVARHEAAVREDHA
ncbi:MAG: hypothetical protein NVS2B4_22080 [Ramlibacter sp.]